MASFSMEIYCILTVFFCMVSSSASLNVTTNTSSEFQIQEATVQDIQTAFRQKKLTSRQLVEFYLGQILRLNPVLNAVIEVNPDALYQADKADQERKAKACGSLSAMHGIPILLLDNIGTKDKLNTTAGSFALLGSVVPRDAGVVKKLRKAGAIILGKASMTEWSGIRTGTVPQGWSARGGQAVNPYATSAAVCGSSTGSAISVAANMAAVSLGTETDGSIICPSSFNAVAGIKPTVGLTSRAGVIPISPREDTVGPICRTVADAVYVLDAIVGYDHNDKASKKASKYIPKGGYLQFLKIDGLRGKRIGIGPYGGFSDGSGDDNPNFQTMSEMGAIVVKNLQLANSSEIGTIFQTSTAFLLNAEFKLAINSYLKRLVKSPVRSLADVIAFNNNNSALEMTSEYGQRYFLDAEDTNGIGKREKAALKRLALANKIGYEKLIKDNKLDAVVTPYWYVSSVLAIGGFPGINVPVGYDNDGVPYGITFSGLKGSEPVLIEIAYAFEQATKVRKPPPVGQ